MFSVVPSVCLSVCLSRFTPLTVWTLDTPSAFWLFRLKPDLIQPTTDKTSLPQPKPDDISFDKSVLLQCGGIHGHYVPLVACVIIDNSIVNHKPVVSSSLWLHQLIVETTSCLWCILLVRDRIASCFLRWGGICE